MADALASPLVVLAALMALALLLAASERRRRLGLGMAFSLLAAGWLLGSSAVVDPIVRRWEAPYVAGPAAPVRRGPRWIVVLAAGARDAPGLPPAARLASASLYRVAEGVRLQRRLPQATLLLLTGAPGGSARSATFAEAAQDMGADPQRLRLLPGAENTAAEAAAVAAALPNGAALYLVTEALHLPRADQLFRRAGLAPVPVAAQVDAAPASRPLVPGSLVPRAENYRKLERLLHEQLGLWTLGRLR